MGSLDRLLGQKKGVFTKETEGHPDGSVGSAPNFGSGHDLAVHGFEPRVGFCAAGSEPGAWSLLPILCLPLSLPLPRSCSLSLSLSLSLSQK